LELKKWDAPNKKKSGIVIFTPRRNGKNPNDGKDRNQER